MKPYNSKEPLIFIHIPKCAGTSIIRILRKWFGEKGLAHYYRKYEALLPVKHRLEPGVCIYGHFNNERGFGVKDYYPGVTQFVTFLRDPLEMAKSNYFFWKKKRREIRIKLGQLKPGDYYDYTDIDDYFRKRPRSTILKFMPYELNKKNFIEILEKYFIYIGIVEDIQTSIDHLAEKLNFPSIKVERLNIAERNEELCEGLKREFLKNNQLEYAIYNYALTKYKN